MSLLKNMKIGVCFRIKSFIPNSFIQTDLSPGEDVLFFDNVTPSCCDRECALFRSS